MAYIGIEYRYSIDIPPELLIAFNQDIITDYFKKYDYECEFIEDTIIVKENIIDHPKKMCSIEISLEKSYNVVKEHVTGAITEAAYDYFEEIHDEYFGSLEKYSQNKLKYEVWDRIDLGLYEDSCTLKTFEERVREVCEKVADTYISDMKNPPYQKYSKEEYEVGKTNSSSSSDSDSQKLALLNSLLDLTSSSSSRSSKPAGYPFLPGSLCD